MRLRSETTDNLLDTEEMESENQFAADETKKRLMQYDTIFWVCNSRPLAIKILYGHYLDVPTNNQNPAHLLEHIVTNYIFIWEGSPIFI